MNFLSQLLYPAVLRPRRRLASFSAFLTIDETGEDELVVTDHPVQYGAEITDHAYKKNPTLTMRIRFSEAETGSPLDETYRRMLELQESRIPFDVITGKRSYSNMLLQSLSCTTDKMTSNVLAITAQMRQIKIVDVVVTTVPPRERQAQPGRTGATENAGQKKAEPVPAQDQSKKQSALKSVAGSFG